MYVDATNRFIKAQNHSLHSLKNLIIDFFFKETYMQKGASVDLRQQKFCVTKMLQSRKRPEFKSHRTILHLHC